MKQKKVSMNYRPLSLSMSMDVVGSVAGKQTYSADFGEYAPDYTLTPLVLYPRCIAVDPNGIIGERLINGSLTNMRWEQIINGTTTTITELNTSYEITQSGTTKGQIKIKRNASVNTPITFRFSAEYLDTRTNQVFKYNETYLLKCVNATEAVPVLSIDSASTVLYDPIYDAKNQTIKAVLKISEKTVATARRRFFWYVRDEAGNLLPFNADVIGFVSCSDDTAVIDRELCGNKITLVCRAAYAASGSIPGTPDLSIEESVTSIVRRFPRFDYDIYNLPDNINPGITSVSPKLMVTTAKGPITNPLRWLSAKWFVQRNTSGSSWIEVANGENPSVPLAEMVAQGLNIAVDVIDRGALLPAVDATSKVFTDATGKVLLIN